MCGGAFGIDGTAIPLALVSKYPIVDIKAKAIILFYLARQQPFIVGVFTDPSTALTSPTTGFNLDYTQVFQ